MKHAAPVRKELGMRTILNILGPLTNPAGAPNQVMGVFHQRPRRHPGARAEDARQPPRAHGARPRRPRRDHAHRADASWPSSSTTSSPSTRSSRASSASTSRRIEAIQAKDKEESTARVLVGARQRAGTGARHGRAQRGGGALRFGRCGQPLGRRGRRARRDRERRGARASSTSSSRSRSGSRRRAERERHPRSASSRPSAREVEAGRKARPLGRDRARGRAAAPATRASRRRCARDRRGRARGGDRRDQAREPQPGTDPRGLRSRRVSRAATKRHGATCLSVLTDREYLRRLRRRPRARRATPAACRCCARTSSIDPYQVYEARAMGADCILLIVDAAPDADAARARASRADRSAWTCSSRCHDGAELEIALAAPDARSIGINNRDLRTFATRLETTLELLRARCPRAGSS